MMKKVYPTVHKILATLVYHGLAAYMFLCSKYGVMPTLTITGSKKCSDTRVYDIIGYVFVVSQCLGSVTK